MKIITDIIIVRLILILVFIMVICQCEVSRRRFISKEDDLAYVDNPVESGFPGHWLPVSLIKRIMEMRVRTTEVEYFAHNKLLLQYNIPKQTLLKRITTVKEKQFTTTHKPFTTPRSVLNVGTVNVLLKGTSKCSSNLKTVEDNISTNSDVLYSTSISPKAIPSSIIDHIKKSTRGNTQATEVSLSTTLKSETTKTEMTTTTEVPTITTQSTTTSITDTSTITTDITTISNPSSTITTKMPSTISTTETTVTTMKSQLTSKTSTVATTTTETGNPFY